MFTARITGRQPTVSVARATVSVRHPVGLSFRTGGGIQLESPPAADGTGRYDITIRCGAST